jgi:predicted DNA-binding transcriptional regulator
MITKGDILKLDIRRNIYNFVENNPGLNIREISRKLNIPKSTLIYHILYLKKLGIVSEKIKGKSKLIFISTKIGRKDKEIILLLRQKIPRRIFLYHIFAIAFSQKDICNEFGLSPVITNYHIKKFLRMGIFEEAPIKNGKIYPFKGPKHSHIYIKRKPIGTEKIYRQKTSEIINDIYRVLITHKSSLTDDDIINSYITYLNEVELLEKEYEDKGVKIPAKYPDFNKRLASVLDFFEEFFRPPIAY